MVTPEPRKLLYLLRHAKSSWDDPALSDFERPLNKRGRKAAPLMGRVMRERSALPDVVVCSPAVRARQTAELVLQAAAVDTELVFDATIYEASVRTLLSVLARVRPEVSSVLLVGHNPGLADLLQYLTAAREHFPTAALACLRLDVQSWRDLQAQSGSLLWIVRPKEL